MEDKEKNIDKKDFITYAKESIGLEDLEIRFKKLDENAVIPSYAYDGDVGMDMTAISVEYDEEKDLYIYHTGLAFESPFNYGQLLFPRSSNRKTDAYLCNSVGIADSAIYRGEIIFCYKNRDSIDSIAEREANKAMMEYFTTSSVDNESIVQEATEEEINPENMNYEQLLQWEQSRGGVLDERWKKIHDSVLTVF